MAGNASSGKYNVPIIIAAAGVLFLGGIALVVSNRNSNLIPDQAKTAAVTPTVEKNTMGGKGSQEYNRKLLAESQQNLEVAKQGEKTYVPPVMGKIEKENQLDLALRPKEPPKEMGKVPDAAPVAKAPQGPTPQQIQQEQQAMQSASQAYTQQLSKMTTAFTYQAATTTTYKDEALEERKKMMEEASKAAAEAAKNPRSGTPMIRYPFKSGDMFYAINDLGLNSDEGGPVLSTIVSGPLKGAKVFGAFKRADERLVVEYNRIVAKDGLTYEIKGYAVDPNLDKASIADAVDNHYLSRWGGLMAAGFLQGLGQATQQSGSTTTGGLGYSQYAMPELNLMEKGVVAAGSVAQKMSQIAMANFMRPPTVEAYSSRFDGAPIGILIYSTGHDAKAGGSVLTERTASDQQQAMMQQMVMGGQRGAMMGGMPGAAVGAGIGAMGGAGLPPIGAVGGMPTGTTVYQ